MINLFKKLKQRWTAKVIKPKPTEAEIEVYDGEPENVYELSDDKGNPLSEIKFTKIRNNYK